VDALSVQLAEVRRTNEQLQAEMESLKKARSATGIPSTDLAALDAKIGSLESQITALRQRQDDVQDRMNALSVDLQSTRELALRAQPPRTAPSQPPEGDQEAPPAPGAEGGSATGLEDDRGGAAVEDTYSAAYADFTKGNYALAISGFQEFLRRYPGSELADNAQFWIAESSYAQEEYDTAAKEYDEVIEKYPKGDRVPAAYLKKALCLMQTDRAAEAVVLLQHLIQTYPTSEEAALARDRLEGMGVKP
jgi:tol-pal system protein YbgF